MEDRNAMPTTRYRGKAISFFEDVVLQYDGDECITWPYHHTNGYGRVWKDRKMHLVSRLLCEIVHGPPPTSEHHAAHSCGHGNLGCVTKQHLSWKTSKENNADKIMHGTNRRGEEHGNCKISEEQVLEIFALRGTETQSAIGKRFGLASQTINHIHRGRTWGWLTTEGSTDE